MTNASVFQAVVAVLIVTILSVMLVRTIGDFILMFRDVVERVRQRRWESSLWRDVGRSLESQRRAMRARRRVKV